METQLDQPHTGLRILYGDTTGPTSHWVEDSSMETHTGPTSHWVEDSSMGTQLDQPHTGLRIALWRHILDQPHTEVRVKKWNLLVLLLQFI